MMVEVWERAPTVQEKGLIDERGEQFWFEHWGRVNEKLREWNCELF